MLTTDTPATIAAANRLHEGIAEMARLKAELRGRQYSMRQEIPGFCDSLQFFTAKDDAAAVKYAKASAKKDGRKLLTVRTRVTMGQPWAPVFEA